MQHGLLCAADNWVNNDAMSPAFLLAKAGYDVWLGNTRGSRHSRKHIKYNADRDSEFWEYSFQQMAYFDLPAVIDYVTGQVRVETGVLDKKIAYIGHSQGTTQMFMGMARDKEFYKERVSAYIALAPGIVPTKPAEDYNAERALGDNIGDTIWNAGIHEFFGGKWRSIVRGVIGTFPFVEGFVDSLYANATYNSAHGTKLF